jgi:hypothetical protein
VADMTTVQIVGIAVAAVVVLILVVALVLTRRRGETQEPPRAAPEPRRGSFLDEAPQDTFAGLGKAEQPVEDVTIDPAVEREARRAAEASATAAAAAASHSDEAEVTGEMPALSPPAASPEPPRRAAAPPRPSPESGGHASPESARPAEGGSVAPEAAPESDAGGRMVPLSSIIVTTSRKMVDVEDPEVRRMLTDLVKFEIDQATQFRRDGQTIDAVLQLTEAEKISRALGMQDAARHIHQMMQEIQAG